MQLTPLRRAHAALQLLVHCDAGAEARGDRVVRRGGGGRGREDARVRGRVPLRSGEEQVEPRAEPQRAAAAVGLYKLSVELQKRTATR
jgi:hypothetical protein